MEITSIIYKLLYSFRDWLYEARSAKIIESASVSMAYIALLLWFTHIDITYALMDNNVDLSLQDAFIHKHAHFLSLLANWGLVFMLYFDLAIANNVYSMKAATILNLISVSAIIFAFWFSSGCILKPEHQIIADKFGMVAQPMCATIAFAVFVISLCYLKFLTLKPQIR